MRAIHRHRNWNNATIKAASFSLDDKLGGGNILLWGLGSGQRSYFDQWNNAVYKNWLETDPALRGDMAQYSQDSGDPNVATTIPDNYGGAMTYVDPVVAANPSLAPYVHPTNAAELQAQIDAQKWAEDQARLAAQQAAAAEAARLAEMEAARQAMIAEADKYAAQREAEALAQQAEAARLRALQTAADAQATAAQIAWAQSEALRIAQEAKASAEAYAAQQAALKKANEAAAKAAAEYADSLVKSNTQKTTIVSDSGQIFIAGGVAAVGILVLLLK